MKMFQLFTFLCVFVSASFSAIQLRAAITGLLCKEEEKEKPEVIAGRFVLSLFYTLLSLVFIALMCIAET
jgi:hypothetical protein